MGYSFALELRGVKVFATANNIDRLSKPLASRFRRLFLPRYTEEQFLDVAVKVCPKLSEETARMIGVQVWNQQGDIRDVLSVSKLVKKQDGAQEIMDIILTLDRYSKNE
jgi:hypothetical protein